MSNYVTGRLRKKWKTRFGEEPVGGLTAGKICLVVKDSLAHQRQA